MAEQIGKVILDDTFYPGEDLYCDGAVEDTLLSIVMEHPESDYPRIIEERGSWPILYHLSHFRENIVNWLPVDKSMKVLEVGSGCGAITGALAKRAGSVTCVDLSKKRSMINAYRHKDCDNVTIKMGNFKDIEPSLDTDYDYVFLIGVFEYGQGYMGSDTPYQDFMNILRKHCAKDGRIVIAIENRYGLKYFAGCSEDHVGTYFEGIEDYPHGGGVRTFSRNKLIDIMKSCGVEEYYFYYPYPDYKFTTTVYSDEYLPRVGELTNNMRNFDRERLLLFDEKNVYDGLIRDGMFADFSNSFLVVIGKKPETLYAKFSNDRKAEYAICTTIAEDEVGVRYVEKHADMPQSQTHIAQLESNHRSLQEKYAGSGLLINACAVTRQDGVRFEYLSGKTLEETLDECVYRNDEKTFCGLLERFVEIAHYNEDKQISDYDLIFSNIIIDEANGEWTLIDYEWTFEKAVSGAEALKRAMFVYCIGPEMRRRWLFERGIAQKYGVAPDNLEKLQSEELVFQKEVTGNRASMYELYDQMGQRCWTMENIVIGNQTEDRFRAVQIYMDRGSGFSEADSKFMQNVYDENDCLQMTVVFGNDIKQLRVDPAMRSCMLYDLKLTLNGRVIFAQDKAEVELISNGVLFDERLMVFATEDPNFTVDLGKTELSERNVLSVSAKVEWASAVVTDALCKQEKEKKRKRFFR